MDDLDAPEAQRTGLLPAPVGLDEAQVEPVVGHVSDRPDRSRLVELAQMGLNPRRPDHVNRLAPAQLGQRLQQEGPAEAVVGVEVRHDDHLHVLNRESTAAQVRQRGRRGLHQHVLVQDEAVPVAPRRGEEVARPEEGQRGHWSRVIGLGSWFSGHSYRVSARDSSAATRIGSPTTASSGTGRRR